jgi:hypothetical protein
VIEDAGAPDVFLLETNSARVTINPPRSRLARAIWRWLGIVWILKSG